MILQGELPVGFFNLFFACVAGDAEQFVVVFLGAAKGFLSLIL